MMMSVESRRRVCCQALPGAAQPLSGALQGGATAYTPCAASASPWDDGASHWKMEKMLEDGLLEPSLRRARTASPPPALLQHEQLGNPTPLPVPGEIGGHRGARTSLLPVLGEGTNALPKPTRRLASCLMDGFSKAVLHLRSLLRSSKRCCSFKNYKDKISAICHCPSQGLHMSFACI